MARSPVPLKTWGTGAGLNNNPRLEGK